MPVGNSTAIRLRTRNAQRRPVHLKPARLEMLTSWIDRYRLVKEQQFHGLDAVAQWLGPRGLQMKIEEYDLRTGGSYRYEHSDDSGSYRFASVFHTVRENEFIVQTFEYLGFPDVVSLETLTFVDLGNVPASWSAIPCTRDRRPATAWRKRVWRPV